MSIRVKFRPDGKAMIRFGDKMEEQWFTNMMRSIRDSDPKGHPAISLKNKDGDIPKLPKPKTAPQKGTPIPPEILEKMKMEKVKVEKKTNEMKK